MKLETWLVVILLACLPSCNVLPGIQTDENRVSGVIKQWKKPIILEGAVKSNYARFVGKIPANSKSSASFTLLDDGTYLFEATSSGKVPGSKAIYQKWVESKGKTVKMLKTTVDPSGNIVH